MASDPKPSSSENKNVSINGDVSGVVVVGDNNNVVNNQTIIQKIINYIFPSEKESLEHRNRRILLGHVENAWIKGVLDASLHGAALLDLGIKQDPEAVTKYPWAIKKESTDETLPAGTSMLEIFDSIGMGRSLLILGAPGSGKTTMLLELARQLIQRAREDVTQPIPMVFNLSSWTEKLTLADWLAQELNNLYSVPRKTAPDWVKGNKLLLLLDGLDEVRQESRAKCVEAINEFRKQNGLTSLAVCSRSQDYADLNAKLSFEGAIEVQPLTQKQITKFFNRFGNEMAGIKQVFKKDSALREMAETPLFLSIMLMAYRDKRDVEISVSGDERARRKHLFDTYIEHMFERKKYSQSTRFSQPDTLRWLFCLAKKMITLNQVPISIENIGPQWLTMKKHIRIYGLICGLFAGLSVGLILAKSVGSIVGIALALSVSLLFGVISQQNTANYRHANTNLGYPTIKTVLVLLLFPSIFGSVYGLVSGLSGIVLGPIVWVVNVMWIPLSIPLSIELNLSYSIGVIAGLTFALLIFLSFFKDSGFYTRLLLLFIGALAGIFFGNLVFRQLGGSMNFMEYLKVGLINSIFWGFSLGLVLGLVRLGEDFIKLYSARLLLALAKNTPWRIVLFLNHCVDLLFLRRVGRRYIFIHRLLMEHFAEMYVETPTSKGNQK